MDGLFPERASEAELRLLAAHVERAHLGVMLLDDQARLLRANRAARALLHAARGIALGGGHLVSTGANGAYVLRGLGRALASGRDVWLPVARELEAPLALVLRPLGTRTALALVSAPDGAPAAPEPALRELFGLSDSEARVVSLLARGRDIARIANELGVQPNTCRSHLKSAYTKTGTRTQAQLAVLVATSVAIA